MSQRGNLYNNAQAESFMKMVKVEEVHVSEHQAFDDVAEDLIAVFISAYGVCLCFGWRGVSDGFLPATVVEPVDPFESDVFYNAEAAP